MKKAKVAQHSTGISAGRASKRHEFTPAKQAVKAEVIQCRLGVLPDREGFDTLSTQESVGGKLAYQFWQKLGGLASRIEGWLTPGIPVFAVEATLDNPDSDAIEIPEILDYSLDNAICYIVPHVIRSPQTNLRKIFGDTVDGWGKLEVFAKFFACADSINITNLPTIINSGQIDRSNVSWVESISGEQPLPPSSARPQTPAEVLRSLAASLPQVYEQRAAALADMNHAFRQELANQLAPALNAKIQDIPHETLEQKEELCRWLSTQIEPLGIAVKDPKTGFPAELKADVGDRIGIGRFQFRYRKEGKTVRSQSLNALPVLQLIDATPSLEPQILSTDTQIPWQDKVGANSSRSSRKRGE